MNKGFPWRLAIIGTFIVFVCLVLLRFCGNGGLKKVVDTSSGDSAFIASKAAAQQYSKDSLAFAEKTRAADLELLKLQDDNKLLTSELLKTENRIKKLTPVWVPIPGDGGGGGSGIGDCAELAREANRLVSRNEEQRIKQMDIDRQAALKYNLLDSIRKACETDRLAAYGDIARIEETYSKLKDNNKPEALKVFAGVSGIYGPVTQGAGPVVMVKTPKDKLYGGAYYVTNGKPMYEVRALFKISFRKKQK